MINLRDHKFCRLLFAALMLFGSAIIQCGAVHAQTIKYKITAFGASHVHVTLSGSSLGSITPTVSLDGRTIRITGAGVTYVRDESSVTSSLVSLANAVKRGAYTDLVINLTDACEITTSKTGSNLKVFIKKKKEGISAQATVSGTPMAAVTQPTAAPQKRVSPFTVVVAGSEPGQGSQHQGAGLTIMLPSNHGLIGSTSLSSELRAMAYALDIMWGWTTSSSLSYDAAAAYNSAGATDSGRSAKELEALVKELTDELVDVRDDLAKKDDLLKQCRNTNIN